MNCLRQFHRFFLIPSHPTYGRPTGVADSITEYASGSCSLRRSSLVQFRWKRNARPHLRVNGRRDSAEIGRTRYSIRLRGVHDYCEYHQGFSSSAVRQGALAGCRERRVRGFHFRGATLRFARRA